MIPFVIIGFMVVYLFQAHPSQELQTLLLRSVRRGDRSTRLLRPDRTLAGTPFDRPAFPDPRPSRLSSSRPNEDRSVCSPSPSSASIFAFLPEPVDYVIDPAKGWEWIPGYFDEHQYEHSVSRWHPMGRTDVFRILDHDLTENVFLGSGSLQSKSNPADVAYVTPGTFEINLIPPPELAYLSTNFLAGTPIYNFSSAGLRERGLPTEAVQPAHGSSRMSCCVIRAS